MKNTVRAIQSLFALIVIATAGCGGTTTTAAGYTYYDPYYYYSYYPADIYYSGYYWTDPYSTYYFQVVVGGNDGGAVDAGAVDAGAADASVVADAGGTGNIAPFRTVGDAIRALALGQQVCPNNVTITPKMGPNLCASAGAPATVRDGVTIQFSGCMLSDGGKLDGTYDVQVTRSASDTACNASTTISVANTTTVTNLTYAGPGGRKLVIPNQTGTSTLTYAIGQAPTSSALALTGRMQVFAVSGATLLDNTFTGSAMVTPNDKTAYVLDGSLTLQDQLVTGTTTLTTQGLTRTTDCCRPTAGTLTAVRTGATNAGTHTWSFGPSCGAAKFDNTSISLPASCL